MPYALYAKIEHLSSRWNGSLCETYTTVDYFTFSARTSADADGCACSLFSSFDCNKKTWHGIYERTMCVFVTDHYETCTAQVHIILSCGLPNDNSTTKRGFGIKQDMFSCAGGSSGTCNLLYAVNADCPISEINFVESGGDIVNLWIRDTPWE